MSADLLTRSEWTCAEEGRAVVSVWFKGGMVRPRACPWYLRERCDGWLIRYAGWRGMPVAFARFSCGALVRTVDVFRKGFRLLCGDAVVWSGCRAVANIDFVAQRSCLPLEQELLGSSRMLKMIKVRCNKCSGSIPV